MTTDRIDVKIINQEKELQLLKEQKEKLVDLSMRIQKTHDELVNSNLSGKTYNASIKNNEIFVNTIKKRIETLTVLITKLEDACNIYNNYVTTMNQSITGGK